MQEDNRGFVAPNEDDDNKNNKQDKDPTDHPVAGENDLKRIFINQVVNTGKIVLKAEKNGDKITLWGNKEKNGSLITLPKEWTDLNTVPKELWVEGVVPSASVDDSVVLVLEYYDGGNKIQEDKVKITVGGVEKIEVVSGATDIDDGSATPANTNVCAAIKESGDVIIKAILNPNIPETDIPPGLVTWTGGEEVTGHILQRKVSKSAWAKHTITANYVTNSATMLVYIIGAENTGYSPQNGTSGTHFSDNSQGYTNTGIIGPDPASGYYESRCEIQFSVKPDSLATDGNAGLFNKDKIQWDVSRDKRVKVWKEDSGSWSVIDDRSSSWASDDSVDTEEDNNPWDGNGHLYGNDRPSWTGNGEAIVDKMNMREWVRVGLGGTTGRNGTRCSDY